MDFITSAPLWIQAPIVVAVAVVLCGVLAFFFLRLIDIAGAKTYQWFEGKNEK
ncbi:hypothetical protein CKALI_03525 [Corynebacterium kalinowskii]|uniref:Uncharacterized protein n=1 Tax=Corynebacterium kalinowskii TaxID=2675216 RepID=A0A6B8W1Q8_9CORY|nr:hypothetical protein [Corynebacterium kalinowskii]QGU01588.1 hypothetical protein CKALI_03525 [Corynebacterium kalinowskii]